MVTEKRIRKILEKHFEEYDSDCGIHYGCACGVLLRRSGTPDYGDGSEAWRKHVAKVLMEAISPSHAEPVRYGPIGPGSRVRVKKGAYIWYEGHKEPVPDQYIKETGTVRYSSDDQGDCLVDFDVPVLRVRWVNQECLKQVGR